MFTWTKSILLSLLSFLSCTDTLLLPCSTELLLAVLLLLPLLAAHHDAWGFLMPSPNETVLGLVLLRRLDTVIRESKACTLSTAKASLHAEEDSGLGRALVALNLGQVFGKHLLELLLVRSGEARVQDVQEHLAALEKPVCQQLARVNGDCPFGRHVSEGSH